MVLSDLALAVIREALKTQRETLAENKDFNFNHDAGQVLEATQVAILNEIDKRREERREKDKYRA